jgi:hypothetical protein
MRLTSWLLRTRWSGPASAALGCCFQIGNQKPGQLDTRLLSRATCTCLGPGARLLDSPDDP